MPNKKTGKDVECNICGRVFYRSGCLIKEKNYCSKSCAGKANKPKTGKNENCPLCGKETYLCFSEISAGKTKKYCSKACANKANGPKVSEKMKGRRVSQETKEKLSAINKGRKLSQETINKLSGENASNWKGGLPTCKGCGKQINYRNQYCIKCSHKNRTPEHQANLNKSISKAMKGSIPPNMNKPGKFGNIARGYYDINGKNLFFRSRWEANYALYLDWLKKRNEIKNWEYEPDTFIFEGIKSGTQSYRPDFKVTLNNNNIEYHEVKGWMTPKSKTQLKRMAKYHPNVKLLLIDKCGYVDIENKIGRMLGFYEKQVSL